ncbi:MAG: heme-binding protein [Dehalococcoidia bacterium]|nr:heme-binding protein [Dehalococcoidia bacterium]
MYKVESLGVEEAKTAIEAMLQEALEPGQPVSMAVVDNRGDLICYARMDGANRFNQLMAIRKAVTSVQIGIDTSMFKQALPALNMNIGDFGSSEITIVEGGVCVRKPDTGAVLGGVGVSGRMANEDEALARVGANAVTNL